VNVQFDDGHTSEFHPVWLVDHDPRTLHKTSMQRQLDSAGLDPAMPVPDEVDVCSFGSELRLKWRDAIPGAVDSTQRNVVLKSQWLRDHCYDEKAIKERNSKLENSRRLWDASDLPKERVFRADAAEFEKDDETLRGALEALSETGVVIISGMPQSLEETERIVRRIGPPKETFYGAMYDTAPKTEGEVNDTAYTKDALHGHTDTSYLIDSAGLQIFNCVAQSKAKSLDGLNHEGEIEGATKLVDGFKVLEVMKTEYPAAFNFFAETPLKWHCIEDGVFVKAWRKVIEFEPGSKSRYRQFTYNSYDLSPVDYLRPDQVLEYYKCTKIINNILRDPKYISYMRMNVGEMLIIDNHRVCHGRTAFSGFRNMVGCYMGRDDWLSTLRHLRMQKGISTALINDE